jgi:hypothetical protein
MRLIIKQRAEVGLQEEFLLFLFGDLRLVLVRLQGTSGGTWGIP